MKKVFSLTIAAMLAGTMVVLSFSSAEARHRAHYYGGSGAAAGFIAGAIIGGAIANSRRRYSGRHCHSGYCHSHSYYSDHAGRPVAYAPPPRRRVGRGDAHESWCYRKYRSYRAWDDTFQPYRGGRRYCRSPYR